MIADSNIVIYGSQDGDVNVQTVLARPDLAVSAITIVEVLGYSKLTDTEKAQLEIFFDTTPMIDITESIVFRATGLRQQRKMSVADAIIAVTALELQMPLAARNTADFNWIPGLELFNPYAA